MNLRRSSRHVIAWMLLAAGCAALPAYAHKSSDSYLSLKAAGHRIEGQWDISLRDLEFAIGLDDDGNGELTWDEIRTHHGDIAAYAMSRLSVSAADIVCPLRVEQHLVDDHTDGAYAVLRFRGDCAADADVLHIRYGLLFDVDPQHRGLLRLESGGHTVAVVFSPDKPQQRLGTMETGRWDQFVTYLRYGVWHIWIGFDHILFLLSLLLPAVLIYAGRQWLPADGFKSSAIDVCKIVTAFTVAHSITLTLAALHVMEAPSRWVESAIAASVVVAAINNIVPFVQGKRWIAAFLFGLIHGLGFASVLSDLGLPRSSLALALVGFNAGVETGQLAIVAAFLPLAYALRASWFYRRMVMTGGSVAITLVALVWLVERAFDLKMLPA